MTPDAKPATRSKGRAKAPLSPREERRRQLQELSRLHLLDAAEQVFAEKGFEAAAVKEIASRAELSVGSVYQLFENKKTMFTEVFRRRNGEGLSVIKAALASSDTPLEQLHSLVDATIDYYVEHRNFFLLFQRAIGGSWLNIKAGFDSRNFDEYLEFVAVPAEVFHRGVDRGVFLPIDPDGMAVMYTGMLQAYLLHEVIGLDGNPTQSPSAMPREQLHELFDRAFALSRDGAPA